MRYMGYHLRGGGGGGGSEFKKFSSKSIESSKNYSLEHQHMHILTIKALTHHPSSQGWAPRCPIHFVFTCLYILFWGGVPGLGFLSSLPLRLT